MGSRELSKESLEGLEALLAPNKTGVSGYRTNIEHIRLLFIKKENEIDLGRGFAQAAQIWRNIDKTGERPHKQNGAYENVQTKRENWFVGNV